MEDKQFKEAVDKHIEAEQEELCMCLECEEDFVCETDLELCDNCMELFDTDRLWELHDNNKIDALDFNESENMREEFRLKE